MFASKVEEIDTKAEEDFYTEKCRLVQQQKLLILDVYKTKQKNVERQKKIQRSQVKNAARLKILSAMNEHVTRVVAETKKKLTVITDQEKRYRPFLERLILEGLYRLQAKNVVLVCRKKDVKDVQAALEVAVKTFRKKTNILNCSVVIDKNASLPEDAFGGVVLSSNGGKIRVVNTLSSRLDLIASRIMPQIRTALFGPNKHRKHKD
ncbi:hypothetical protein HPB48_008570 [Haemaphysalis longicornis]|uniref:Vacuolar ATP synthase subunit E n=1 Tax=Haemaphysalis longicornis TaxID=44386 RepID=A0A9J6G5V9_HAELO|nr:hypothetical protein HPB48_008570 [Haemaphysalis longicornis]